MSFNSREPFQPTPEQQYVLDVIEEAVEPEVFARLEQIGREYKQLIQDGDDASEVVRMVLSCLEEAGCMDDLVRVTGRVQDMESEEMRFVDDAQMYCEAVLADADGGDDVVYYLYEPSAGSDESHDEVVSGEDTARRYIMRLEDGVIRPLYLTPDQLQATLELQHPGILSEVEERVLNTSNEVEATLALRGFDPNTSSVMRGDVFEQYDNIKLVSEALGVYLDRMVEYDKTAPYLIELASPPYVYHSEVGEYMQTNETAPGLWRVSDLRLVNLSEKYEQYTDPHLDLVLCAELIDLDRQNETTLGYIKVDDIVSMQSGTELLRDQLNRYRNGEM